MKIGYFLSSEEFDPRDLVDQARRAEAAGFHALWISDHYHPWIDAQGNSPFVWSVLGAVAQVTERVHVLTGVTCPTMRIHPAIVAQAAATTACMMPGRFALGVGTGENLNEHILGDRWPAADERLEMLQEAVRVMRLLWEGGTKTHRGPHYTVENARLYNLPDEPIEVMVAASGQSAIDAAGRIGDGLVSLAPMPHIVESFERAGGEGKPTYAETHCCYGRDEAEMRKVAAKQWPITGVKGQLPQELALPSFFEQASDPVDEESATAHVACGDDPDRHIEEINNFVEAGFDHVWVHNIGPNQEGFFDFYADEVLPKLR